MFVYYAMNIGLNVGAIVVAQYFNFSSKQADWVVIVAIISIIIHFFIIQKVKKIAFEPITNKERLNELSSTSSRLESLRWFSNWGSPIMCLIFLAGNQNW